jgi:hypothetical protein
MELAHGREQIANIIGTDTAPRRCKVLGGREGAVGRGWRVVVRRGLIL